MGDRVSVCAFLEKSLREQVQEHLTGATEILTVHITVPVIQAMIAEMESLRGLISKVERDFNITPTEAIMAMAKEGMAGLRTQGIGHLHLCVERRSLLQPLFYPPFPKPSRPSSRYREIHRLVLPLPRWC